MAIVNDKKTLLCLTVRQEGFMNTEEFGHQAWDTGFQFSLKNQMPYAMALARKTKVTVI